jgi:hypothetical protein
MLVDDIPVESPIEEALAHELLKYVHPEVNFVPQHEVKTVGGVFRLDFLLERNGRRVAIECDGRDFHDSYRDEWRDAMLLGDGCIDVMYRLRGADILLFTADLLFLVARQEPPMFTERGHINLRTLAHPEVRDWDWRDWETQRIGPIGQNPDVGILFLRRRKDDLQKERSFLAKYYNHAVSHGGGSLEELQASWAREHPLRVVGEAG